MSWGSIGRYGTAQTNSSTVLPASAASWSSQSKPFLMAFTDRQLVAVLHRATDLVDVGEVDLRVDALREEVHAQGHQADVPRPLAVAEQAALDAVGTGQVTQLGRGHAGAAVVVRVQRHDDRLAPVEVPDHPLDRVRIHVRRGHLDR